MLFSYLGMASLLVALALILVRRERFHGTTLVAPVRWTMLCLTLLVVTEFLLGSSNVSSPTEMTWRYVAATATFCPLIALLGAKRPQNVAWQFIVASLWGVMILPVAQTLVLWQGGALDVGPARRWFLVILLGIGLTNYLLTRFWLSAILATAGQIFLVMDELPFSFLPLYSWRLSAGYVAIALAILCVWFQTRQRPSAEAKTEQGDWVCVWSDFRNAFGMIWSLRVIERVNATAKICDWTSELTWFGFADRQTPSEGELQERERTIRTLLRRFVSNTWITQRLGKRPGTGAFPEAEPETELL